METKPKPPGQSSAHCNVVTAPAVIRELIFAINKIVQVACSYLIKKGVILLPFVV